MRSRASHRCRAPNARWLAVALLLPAPLGAQDGVPKQVYLVVDGTRLVASNIRQSRFDELKLNAGERIVESSVGDAAIVVATNRRILGYGSISGWRIVDRIPNERIETISADDYAGLVVTSQRLLNFNGQTGVWAEHGRMVER